MKSKFSDEQLIELRKIIKDDIAELFFALFLKKKSWQSAMKESKLYDDTILLNEQIDKIVSFRKNEMENKIK